MGAISQSIGLFGVTGELGRAFFDALEEQAAFTGRLRLFASERSQEETRVFRDKPLAVEVADTADFSDLNEAVLAVPADIADDLGGRLLAAGVRVWDATGHLRAHPQAVSLADAGPDSLLIVLDDPLVTILAPLAVALDGLSPLARFEATILAPVSARGQAGVRELARQAGDLLNGRGVSSETWPQQVAFNVLAADGNLDAQGQSGRERRVSQGLVRRLPAARVLVRQLVVPVFYGAVIELRWRHAASVDRADVISAVKSVPACKLYDRGDAAKLPSPIGQGVSSDVAWLSRLQLDAGEGAASLLADPLRAGLVQPLLASLMLMG
ncbi:MAG: Asd/ArgC dimerization domain-containing protein [Perlucidibaca sp.]